MRTIPTICVAFILASCGGGGGDSPGPTTANVNQSPSANAGGDFSVVERSSASLDGSASRDSDGTLSSYSWHQISGQAVTINNANQAAADFATPDVSPANENLVFEITVVDNSGATASDRVTVTVTNVNIAPTASAGGDYAVSERAIGTLDGSASADSDGTVSSYSWNQIAGQTVTINNADKANADFTTPEVSPTNEDLAFEITVVDNSGAASTDRVTVTVTNVNIAPTASAGGDYAVSERAIGTLDGSASADTDGTVSSYNWSQIAGQTVTINNADKANADFTTPEVTSANEDLIFELTITDSDSASATDEVMVSVVNVNIAPTANAGPDQTAYSGRNFILDAKDSSDQDGMIVSYSWRLNTGLLIDIPDPDQPQLSLVVPNIGVEFLNQFQVSVTDELGGVSSDLVQVLLRPIIPPVANAGPDQVVESESTVTLSAVGSSDTDGEIVSYQWNQLAGQLVDLGDTTSADISFTAPLVEDENILLQFELTIVDDSETSAVDVVDVTVTPPTFEISGTITVPDGNFVDSDVNNPDAPYAPNDSPDSAQLIPNPAIIGGFANQIGWGPNGRSRWVGDRSDFYRVVLNAGQTVSAFIGTPASGDLDLYLWDLSGTQIIDASLSTSGTETVTAPADGEYLLEMSAFSRASNYVLNIEAAGVTSVGSGYSLHNEFVPNEVVLRYEKAAVSNSRSALKPGLAAALNMNKIAGDVTRPALYSLRTNLETSAKIVGYDIEDMNRRYLALLTGAQRNKWNTLLGIKLLANSPGVVYAEPNYIRRPSAVPDDEFYDRQWHYDYINLPAAWDTTMGDPSITVAVIDTGVLVNHPDLQGQLRDGYDFISSTAISNDGDGIDPDADDPGDSCGVPPSTFHGTHVTGTVAASTNNAIGVAGVAGGVKVMPLRALGCGGGTTYDIGQAVLYAAGLANDSGIIVADPAEIMNLSLGGSGFSQATQDIYTAARNAGVIVVAAAGNSSTNAPFYPAGYDGVISVSAIGAAGVRASYSNFGPATDVAAPGGDFTADVNNDGFADGVFSTDGEDSAENPIEFSYEFKYGTSMASPHMAGVLALMKSVNAALTPDDIDVMLIRGDIVVEIGDPGWDQYYGWGLIDAAKAVAAAIAAVGEPPADEPAMIVSPGLIHFGAYSSLANFDIANGAAGQLVVGEITSEPVAAWLTIEADAIDANGVGTYTATAQRTGLAEGTYNTTVRITSNANEVLLQATILVPSESTESADAGQLYVVMNDLDTLESVYSAPVTREADTLRFTVTGVLKGNYEVVAGSDNNNDFTICDGGESCGYYLEFDNRVPLAVDSDTINIDFPVSYDWFVPASGATTAPEGVSRDVPRGQTQ